MKIFSLETKTHVLGWGIAAGFVVNRLVSIISRTKEDCPSYMAGDCPTVYYQGWPVQATLDSMKVYGDEGLLLFANLLFWILVSLITLSLIRHFKHGNS